MSDRNLPYVKVDLYVSATHDFLRASSAAETFDDIYNALIKVLTDSIHITEIQIFEFLPNLKELFCSKHRSALNIPKTHKCSLGESLVGIVGRDQFSILIEDAKTQKDYPLEKGVNAALCVPIQFNGELFGVIACYDAAPGFFSEEHRHLFALLAEMAASLLARIRQKIELDHYKLKLEQLLEDKKAALHIAVETVSNQFSELKFQRDKREILLREVHHRVNNNLQIINSLVRLYLSQTETPDRTTLAEIQSRIQMLSSIHLILLKSLELHEISLKGFLEDLAPSLRYSSQGNYLSVNFKTPGIKSPFSFSTLIPLGLLIHELIQLAMQQFWVAGEAVEINVEIVKHAENNSFTMLMSGLNCTVLPSKENTNNNVQETIIHAYCDQLEGAAIDLNPSNCNWKFDFQEL